MKLFDFKKLLMAFVLCLMLPLGVSLTACGGGDSGSGGGGGGQTGQISHIEVSVEDAHYDASTNGFVYTYGEEITIPKTAFTVTAYKYDGTTITVNQDDFTIEPSGFSFDGTPDAGYYSVNVALNSDPTLNAPVTIQIKEARIVIPQYSAEELSLVYNGQEQNVITDKLDALATTAGRETISHMIEAGKLSIDTTYSNDTYNRYAATNVQADNNEYFIDLQASSNYLIFASENEQGNGVTDMRVSWKITPKPLNAPTLSQDEVVFDWDVGTDGLYAKTASVSLVFGTGDDDVKENMVTYDREALSSTSCSTHSVYVEFNQDYALNYRFAGDNGDTASVSLVWELVPYTLTNGAVALTGNTDTYVDTDESVYPSYPYSADFVPSTNLTLKEIELFNFEDEGLNHNHFANQEGNELYSYTVSLASGTGIYANCIKIGDEIYDGNGFCLHYHIARIDAPQAVQEAINSVSFEINPQTYDPYLTLTRLFNGSVGSTYCMDKDALTAETQTSLGANWISSENYDADVSKLAYVEDVTINEANETGYTIPLSFYYGFYNYKPIAVSAKLVVNRAQREINNLVYTLSDNNNGKYGYIMYRYNSPIVLAVQELSIWGEDDVTLEMSPTTTYYYSATQNGEYTQAANNRALNVGFYKATITVTANSSNYTFVLDDDYLDDDWTFAQGNDATTWLLTRSFEVLKRTISVGYSLGGTWGTYWTPYSFYVENEPKTINVAPEDIEVYYFGGSGHTSMSYENASADELNDIAANMTVTTSDSNKQITSAPTAVGTYRSMINCTISSNYTFMVYNYFDGETHISTSDVYNAEDIEWEILPRTVDASGVTWNKTTFTCIDDEVLHPEIQNLPKGAIVSYHYSYWYNGQHYTSSGAPGYSSDCTIQATISIDTGVLGYDTDIAITYPAGYDTANDYLEQSYTINQKFFDYTIANFAVVLSHDSAPHGEIVATFDNQGKANIDIEYFTEGYRTPRVVLVREGENGLVIDTIYSFNDHFDNHDESETQYGFPQAEDSIGTSKKITGTIQPWDAGVILTHGNIPFEITWTIVKKTLQMSFTDYGAYLTTDGIDNTYLQQFSPEAAQGSTLSATVGVPYSESKQYLFISAYESQYKNISISGIATEEQFGKVVIPIENVDRETLIEGIVVTITPNTDYCNSTFADGSQSIVINITILIY